MGDHWRKLEISVTYLIDLLKEENAILNDLISTNFVVRELLKISDAAPREIPLTGTWSMPGNVYAELVSRLRSHGREDRIAELLERFKVYEDVNT